MQKGGPQFFIVYLNFNDPDFIQMTFEAKQFMDRIYFLKFRFKGTEN